MTQRRSEIGQWDARQEGSDPQNSTLPVTPPQPGSNLAGSDVPPLDDDQAVAGDDGLRGDPLTADDGEKPCAGDVSSRT